MRLFYLLDADASRSYYRTIRILPPVVCALVSRLYDVEEFYS